MMSTGIPNVPLTMPPGTVAGNLRSQPGDAEAIPIAALAPSLIPAWITPTFSAGNFTGNNAMTWIVSSGNVITYEYIIIGTAMTIIFFLSSTTVGGTPNNNLKIAIPAGKTVANTAHNGIGQLIDNNSRVSGFVVAPAGNQTINIQRQDGGNFSASSGATNVAGQITFEILS